MLTIKTLLQYTKSHKPVLVSNSTHVGISFAPTKQGNDERGYYKEVSGQAQTREKGKKPHKFAIRLYYEKGKNGYIPPNFRSKDKAYSGVEKPPLFTVSNKAWVMCSCPYHKWATEEALTKRGNSELRHSNGSGYHDDGPNPMGIAHICKHIISALRLGALLKK